MVKQKKDSKEREDTYYYIARLIMVFCAFSAAVAFVTGVENAFTVAEDIIFHKLAMAVCALFLMEDNADGARLIALIDGLLAVLIITAYLRPKIR